MDLTAKWTWQKEEYINLIMLLLLSHFSRVRLCDPIDGSPPGNRRYRRKKTEERKNCKNKMNWAYKPIAAAAAKSLQSCPTLCNPIDGSPPGCPVPGILQARTLEWVAIFFSKAWKWKVIVKSLSHVWHFVTPWNAGSSVHGIFPGKSTGVGCHCLLQENLYLLVFTVFEIKIR